MSKFVAPPKFTLFKSDGTPGSGWKVTTYEAGTTTLKDTYTTTAQTTANANPVIFDSRGEANITFDGRYKLKLTDENDTEIWTVDNYGASDPTSTTISGNRIPNGSFESTLNPGGIPDDWDLTLFTGGAMVIDTSSRSHGAQSVKFTSTGSGGGKLTTSAFFEVSANEYVPVQFEIESSVVDVLNIVKILWYDAAKVQLTGGDASTTLYSDAAANPTSWESFHYIAEPPATAFWAKIELTGCDSTDSTTGTTKFDNVVVQLRQAIDPRIGNRTSAGGTVDVITATFKPPVTLTDGYLVALVAAGANKVAGVTFNPDSLGAKTVKKHGNQALIVGDIFGAGHELLLRYDSGNDVWELLNPKNEVSLAGSETLTGKTLTSPILTTPQLNDTSLDHQYITAVSELTADRTVTMPLLTGNDTLVFADFIQKTTDRYRIRN